jgi:diacylglycerol kinase
MGMRQKIWRGDFRHALNGIIYCYFAERSMKIHAIAAFGAVALAFYFQLSAEEWIVLTIAITGVAAAEMFNTALETIVDLVSPDFHPLAKVAKDVAAGAVMVMAISSLVIGYLLFFHRIYRLYE